MKTLLLVIPALAFASCASMQTAGVADFNRDGVISDAESKQYHKQAAVQERNVYTESTKRRNVVNTMGDINEGLYNAHLTRALIRAW